MGYAEFCQRKAQQTLAAETAKSLEGPSGHARRKFSRAELYIYSIRHIQHHAGLLNAYLRRTHATFQEMGVLKWGHSGWPNRQ